MSEEVTSHEYTEWENLKTSGNPKLLPYPKASVKLNMVLVSQSGIQNEFFHRNNIKSFGCISLNYTVNALF